jgi:hypothetical protein
LVQPHRCGACFAAGEILGYASARRYLLAIMFHNRVVTAAIVGLAVGLGGPTMQGDADSGDTAITCTNPVSGASWQILIDYSRATVDSFPATITQTAISWFDPKDGGHYRLDRKSGHLSATVASSTGGFARHAQCDIGTTR